MCQRGNVGAKALAAHLRTLRDGHGLTQSELADLSGMKMDYVKDVELGKAVNPSAHHLTLIARALKADLNQVMDIFLGGDSGVDQVVARHLAEERMQAMNAPPVPEDATIRQITDALHAHPDKLNQWIAFGAFLAGLDEIS